MIEKEFDDAVVEQESIDVQGILAENKDLLAKHEEIAKMYNALALRYQKLSALYNTVVNMLINGNEDK